MYNPDAPLVTLEEIKAARKVIDASPHCHRTPTLHHMQDLLGVQGDLDLHLKLENMQVTGSFKVRGIINQLHHLPPGCGTQDRKLISMSAGNYGKAFAYLAKQQKMSAVVIMPKTAPENRSSVIQGLGAEVERVSHEELQPTVDRYVAEKNMLYLHSFDDTTLIAGHASLGLEILEEVGEPDIVVMPCGGGGSVSGTAAAIKLSGHSNCRIYAVEPQGSRTMHESFRTGRAVLSMAVKSVASGLSPPFAGTNTYKHCRRFVEDILLVSDEEILQAMFILYKHGLLVEPSGAAAFAAVYYNKVPDMAGKKVVVVITGGNVTPHELAEHSTHYL